MKNNDLCPICGVGKLSRKSEMDEVVYKGVRKYVTATYSVCDHCHVDQVGASELKANKRVMNEFKKEVDGLLTGREVFFIRTSLGITQDQASLVFGGGPNAFTKYEKDDVVQSEAMDKLIRLASDIPQAFAALCEKSGLRDHRIRKNHLHELYLARSKRSWSVNPFFQSECADINEQDAQDFVNIT